MNFLLLRVLMVVPSRGVVELKQGYPIGPIDVVLLLLYLSRERAAVKGSENNEELTYFRRDQEGTT